MTRRRGRYFFILLVAGLTTGALTPEPLSPPLELEEYLEADDWFQAGIALNSEGRYRDAAEAFSRSLAIEPGNALSWLNLGTDQALLGDYTPAIVSLKKSIELDPKLALAVSNLAEVCFKADRYQEAIEAYAALLKLWPENANARYKMGLAYLLLNEAGKAQAEYLALKMIDPDLAEKLRLQINQHANH